jgi:hypothetical protein
MILEAVLLGIGIVGVIIPIALAVLTVLATNRAAREHQRIDREIRLAEWHLHQLRRSAIGRLLDEARRHQH